MAANDIKNLFYDTAKDGHPLENCLWWAWNQYLSVLDITLDPFQERDIYLFFKFGQVCFNYCREGGKTWIGGLLVVFGDLIGFQGMWLAAQGTQLIRVMKHWKSNPFVIPFTINKQRQIVYTITGFIEIRIATEDNVRGPHVPWVFYDEVARMDEEAWKASLSIANSALRPVRCYLSTPVLGSIFHTLSKKLPTFTHTYLECPWLNHDDILAQKIFTNPRFWRQENLAEFTLLQGAVFHNIQEWDFPKDGEFPDCDQIRQGIDFGGSKPHTLVRCGEYHGKIYALSEWEFDPADPKDESNITEISSLYPTEAELNGPGAIKIHLVPNASAVFWTEQLKYEQLGYLQKRQIVISPVWTPNLYNDLKKAEYDEKGKVDTSDLDYLAAFIHAASAEILVWK